LKEGLAFFQAEGESGGKGNDDPAVIFIITSLNLKCGLSSGKGKERREKKESEGQPA
jgi:hypothetical protein